MGTLFVAAALQTPSLNEYTVSGSDTAVSNWHTCNGRNAAV